MEMNRNLQTAGHMNTSLRFSDALDSVLGALSRGRGEVYRL